MRVLMGVGAWLLGVGAATAGSLLAVSLLGQGIAPATSQQLTAGAVTSALANESGEASQLTASPPAPRPGAARRHKTQPSLIPLPQTEITPTGSAAVGGASSVGVRPTSYPGPAMPVTGPAMLSSKALTSEGGTVVAECQSVGAYLASWSPAQGYEVGHVARGPAATAQVTFESTANSVTMTVSCAAGLPTASTTVGGGDGGDDGGGGGSPSPSPSGGPTDH